MVSKKLSGDGNLIATLVGLLSVTVLLLYGLAFNQDFATKQKMDSLCRQYIIRLEADGNLDDARKVAFQNEVADTIKNELGDRVDPSSIVVTVVPNTYGNTISLEVSCRIRLEQSKFIDGFNFREENETFTEYYRKISSTSTT